MSMPANGASDHEPGFDSVVFATDFSAGASVAGRFAALYARHSHARLIAAHAFTLAPPALEVETLQHVGSLQRQDLERRLSETVQSLAPVAGRVESVVAEGSAIDLIRQLAQPPGASLVVLSTHGGGTLQRRFIGSIAEEILRTVDSPVLTVGPHVAPPASADLAVRRILYATDFSSASAAAASWAIALARSFGSEIDVMHVLAADADCRSSDDLKDQEQAFLQWLTRLVPDQAANLGRSRTFVEFGQVRQRILEHTADRGIDLIVLGAHHHSRLAMHIRTGPAFQVITAAPCPVFTVTGS
jgi:nucleotide-binding universal stress UspA family protein